MAIAAPQLLQVPHDPHVFLAGRPPLGEFVGFMKMETVEGRAADPGALADQWRAANRRVSELALREAGAADDPTLSPLPPELDSLAEQLLGDARVRASFGMSPVDIKVVELDQLVVFQKKVNLTHAEQLATLLADAPTPEELFHFCLPLDGRYDPIVRAGVIGAGAKGPQAWAMLSPSTDFRVLETVMLDPSQIHGVEWQGRPSHVVGVVVGYGANLVSAMHVGGRLILKNGSHRAYALAASGIKSAPMLIQTVPEGEENEFLPPDVQQQPDLYLTDPRPPMLRDYLDDELRVIGNVPRNTKQVRVALNFEESYVPA